MRFLAGIATIPNINQNKRAEMSDRAFFVEAKKGKNITTGYVPAKFLMRNGAYVMNPTPGGSQKSPVFSDGLGNNRTHGSVANPNNYLIVPANYTEQQARDFAAGITDAWNTAHPGDETGTAGPHHALARMAEAFVQRGPQDLQRHPQWGIPKGSVVSAFVGSASNHLGYVTALTPVPKILSEVGGGAANSINGHVIQPIIRLFGGDATSVDTGGPFGLSRENHANIVQGFNDGLTASKPPSPFNDYGYGPQAQRTAGQIGDGNGVGGIFASAAGINPSNPTQPAPPQTGGVPGLANGQAAPYPGQAIGTKPQASVFDTGAPTVRFISRAPIPPNLT
jgi:hypothetical protein